MKLQKMSEADFGFDENEWLDTVDQDEEDRDVVTEVLKDVEITPEMGREERLRILQTRYPEFESLANELIALTPVLKEMQGQVNEDGVWKAKCRALAAYVSVLSMYFAILTSPSRNPDTQKTLDPAELRDHPIMDSLLQCRTTWTKVKGLKAPAPTPPESDDSEDEPLVNADEVLDADDAQNGTPKKPKHRTKTTSSHLATAISSLPDLTDLLPSKRKASKPHSKPLPTSTSKSTDSDSDFGEADTLSSSAAAQKAARKKSLRFYTSQITQKSNKRAGAGRDAGGDEDLPYRERFRDRQARLNAEAEARGKKLDSYGRGGVALGSDGENNSDAEQDKVAEQVRGDEDEYYDLVAQTSANRKKQKAEKAEMLKKAKAEGGLLRVVEEDEDGKRAIGYVIEKNKGLAPKRKKEVRNPRVKKRMKFEEKKKKLASTRAVYKGGEERGGYSGEKTGIKTGLVKSIKL
jgi:U3 small nucleolar RNA-associated protein 3